MRDDSIKSAARVKHPAFEQQPLPFPIQAAPLIVRAHGLRDTHSFPLVARAKGESFRVSPLQAWHFLLAGDPRRQFLSAADPRL